MARPKGVTTRDSAGEDHLEVVELRPACPRSARRPSAAAPACAARRGTRAPTGPAWWRPRSGLALAAADEVRGLRPVSVLQGASAPAAIAWAWLAVGMRCGATTMLRCLSGTWRASIRLWARNFCTARVELPGLRHVALEGRGQPGVRDDRRGAAADGPGRGGRVRQVAGLLQAVAAGDHRCRRRPRWRR